MANARAGATDSTDAEVIKSTSGPTNLTTSAALESGTPIVGPKPTVNTVGAGTTSLGDPSGPMPTQSASVQAATGTGAPGAPTTQAPMQNPNDGTAQPSQDGTASVASSQPSRFSSQPGQPSSGGAGAPQPGGLFHTSDGAVAVPKSTNPETAFQHFKTDLAAIKHLLDNTAHYASLPVIEVEALIAHVRASLGVIRSKL